MHECEIFLLVDQDGNYVVSDDDGRLADLYEEKINNDAACCRRVVRIVVCVPVEKFVTLSGDAPPEGEANLTVEEPREEPQS